MKTIRYFVAALLIGATLETFSQDKPVSATTKPTPQAGSTKAGQPSTNEAKVFIFSGGDLHGFISAFKDQLGMDLGDEGTIDLRALRLRVPKMKIPLGGSSWELVLNTYNALSSKMDHSLGSWVILRAVGAGGDPTPNAIVFMPPKNVGGKAALKVKAFSLEQVKAEDLRTLNELVEERSQLLRGEAEVTGRSGDFEGRLTYHKATGLLVASGGEEFISMTTTIVDAFKETLAHRNERRVSPPGQ